MDIPTKSVTIRLVTEDNYELVSEFLDALPYRDAKLIAPIIHNLWEAYRNNTDILLSLQPPENGPEIAKVSTI